MPSKLGSGPRRPQRTPCLALRRFGRLTRILLSLAGPVLLARYLLELALIQTHCHRHTPSRLAAASMMISLKAMGHTPWVRNPSPPAHPSPKVPFQRRVALNPLGFQIASKRAHCSPPHALPPSRLSPSSSPSFRSAPSIAALSTTPPFTSSPCTTRVQPAALEAHTRCSVADLSEITRDLVELHSQATFDTLQAVRRKYAQDRFGAVSGIPLD